MSRSGQPIGPDGLTRRDRDIIREVLASYPEVRRTTLFGSRAMGTFGRGSDIDLALEGPDLTPRTLARIAADLEDSDLPYKVDLLLWDRRLDPKLEEHIRRHGKPFGWEETTLGEIVTRGGGSIQTGPFGSQLHASDYVPAGVPCIMPVNIGDNRLIRDGIACITKADAQRLSQHIVRKGDIIYSRRGDVERRALVREEEDGWFCGTGCLKIRLGNSVVVPEFASYYLGHPEIREWIVRHAVGATMPNLNTSIMEAIPFSLPPIDEQRSIAGVLGALDDKIEQNRRTARALERLARAIFRTWFVDFEPVKAKAEGATSFPSMPQPVFDALPTRFVDSDIGPVPEGWKVKPVSVAFDVNPARTLRKGEIAPYLDMKNMPTEGHVPEAWVYREFGSGMKFINGDTLVARITPCLENGKTAFVDFLDDKQVGWGSTEYIVLRPRPPLPELFGYCLARAAEFRDFAIQNMTGTSGRQRVASIAMEHFQIATPSQDAAMTFGEIVKPMFDCVRVTMNESRKLAELRDYLLPKLLSGAVRVKDIEGLQEATA